MQNKVWLFNLHSEQPMSVACHTRCQTVLAQCYTMRGALLWGLAFAPAEVALAKAAPTLSPKAAAPAIAAEALLLGLGLAAAARVLAPRDPASTTMLCPPCWGDSSEELLLLLLLLLELELA